MKKLQKQFIKTALAAAIALSAASAQAAVSLPNFTVDPTVGGTANGGILYDAGFAQDPFEADRINGSYNETLTFTSATTFEASVFWTASVFRFGDDANDVGTITSGLGVDYGLYVLFQGSGTWFTDAAGDHYLFDTGGEFSMFYDDYDTSKPNGGVTGFTNPLSGADLYGLTKSGDDTLLFTGKLFGAPDSEGLFTSTGGQNTGSFGTIGDLALTSAGEKFFKGPVPFYDLALTSGDFTKFTPEAGATVSNVTGKMSVDFGRIPEPETLSLLGIGLLGLGFSRRKQA